jgi:phosphoglycolate phosphatase-like HAD superfamily hydrolase
LTWSLPDRYKETKLIPVYEKVSVINGLSPGESLKGRIDGWSGACLCFFCVLLLCGIEMIGIIFDIDGTLVDSYDLDECLYRRAVLTEVPGVRFRKSLHDYHHSTDSGILIEILTEFNLPVREYYDAVRRRFGKLIRNHLQGVGTCTPIPGTVNLLNSLRQNPNLQIGIATGGWSHTARMKLEAAGLSDLNVDMSSGDDARSRTKIMQICAGRMDPSISEFVYVGDAEWDLRAANKLGWQFIGVGTRLEGKCDKWVADLTNTTPFLELG